MSISLAKTEEQLTNEVMGKISLQKDKVNLEKHVINLSKTVIHLSKEADVDLGVLLAKVVVVLDYSGSMRDLYRNGVVQKTLNRLVPLGLTFDDNGEIDVYTFDNSYQRRAALVIGNYEDYVQNIILANGMPYGGTSYAPVINAIVNGAKRTEYHDEQVTTTKKGWFGKEKTVVKTVKKPVEVMTDKIVDDECPTFILFITDGDCNDNDRTDDILRQISDKNVFIQFIGIGDEKFKYLKHVADLDGRVRDNTGFSKMKKLEDTDDETLYTKVLSEFSHWLHGLQ